MYRILKFGICLLTLLGLILGSFSVAFSQEKVIPGEYYNLSDYEKLTGKKITKFNEAP
ncbi:hypothetical protein H5T89_08285, partial [bacterium]|nr:hypothetical protein [bacterium]